MSETQLDWVRHLPLLLAAARNGSARKAAAQLGMSTATAVRRLSALEEELDTRLFDRTHGGLLPTTGLSLALPWAEQIESAANSLLRELRGLETEPVGTVRVSLLHGMSSLFVAPALPRLLARYPELTVELIPGAAVLDLVRREADLAIRTFRPASGDLIVKRIFSGPHVVVASQQLLSRTQPERLADLPWIDWDHTAARTPDTVWLEQHVPEARVVLRSTDPTTMLRAAQAGVGALMVAEPMARATGGLVSVALDVPPMPDAALYLVSHRAVRHIPRVAAVWDFLLEIATPGPGAP